MHLKSEEKLAMRGIEEKEEFSEARARRKLWNESAGEMKVRGMYTHTNKGQHKTPHEREGLLRPTHPSLGAPLVFFFC